MKNRGRGTYPTKAKTTTKATMVSTTATRPRTVKIEDRRLGADRGSGAGSAEPAVPAGEAIGAGGPGSGENPSLIIV